MPGHMDCVGCAQVMSPAVTNRNGIGNGTPGLVGVAANPKDASTHHEQVRAWIIELLYQGLGPCALLVKPQPLLEMLLRFFELPELITSVEQALMTVDLERT